MKAFILAAGLGTRMRPLTDTTPKPLLKVAGKPLIQYHIERLKQQGFEELVINVSYLAEHIMEALGDGTRFGVSIRYSHEAEPLETAGAITYALPQLGEAPFLIVNADIFTNFPFADLKHCAPELAHLVLVANPGFKTHGDFGLDQQYLTNAENPPYTYAGIGVYNPNYFSDFKAGDSFALGPLLRKEAEHKKVTAQLFSGEWIDVGTPQRLHQLDQQLLNATHNQEN